MIGIIKCFVVLRLARLVFIIIELFNKIQVIILNWIRPTTHGPRNDLNFEREQYVWIIDGDFSISNSSVLEKYLFWWTHQGGIQTDGY